MTFILYKIIFHYLIKLIEIVRKLSIERQVHDDTQDLLNVNI